MRALSYILFFGPLYWSFASASDYGCRLAFGFASAEGMSGEQVALIYDQVWKDLGSAVPKQVIEELIKSDNPFQLPSSYQSKSETLKNTLKEMHEMLSDFPELEKEARKNILVGLRKRIENQNTTDTKQTKVDKQARIPQKLHWAESIIPKLHYSKNGRYLIARTRKNGLKLSDNWGKLKKIDPIGNQGSFFSEFVLAPDGQHAFFAVADENKNLFRVRIFNDKGEFIEKWKPEPWFTYPESKREGNIDFIHFSDNGKWMVGEWNNDAIILSTDDKSLNHTPVVYDSGPTGFRLARFMPNSEEVMIFSSSEAKYINLKGGRTRPDVPFIQSPEYKERLNLDFHEHAFYISRDHSYAYGTIYSSGLIKIDLKSGGLSAIKLSPNRTSGDFAGLTVDKSEKYAFVMQEGATKNLPGKLYTVDLETGKSIKETPLRGNKPHALDLTPDEEHSLITYYGNVKDIHIHATQEFLP